MPAPLPVFATQQWHAQHCAHVGRAREFPGTGELLAFGPEQVMHMHRHAVEDRKTSRSVTIDGLSFPDHRNRAMLRLENQFVAIPQRDEGVICITEFAGALDDCAENRFDICRRRGDHPKYVAAAGLVGQRFREITRLRLHFVEQPDVLDGDDGLVGEGRD